MCIWCCKNSLSEFGEEKTIKLDQMPEGEGLVRGICVFALAVPCHTVVFKTFRWILMNQCEPARTFLDRFLNQAQAELTNQTKRPLLTLLGQAQ